MKIMKTTKQKFNGVAMALVISQISMAAHAATISGPSQIMASTSMAPWNNYTINQMVDGNSMDIAPFNGFTTNSTAGTIRLDLSGGPYDLTHFNLWNDVNVQAEGVETFRLVFYSNGGLISTSQVFTTNPGQTAVQQFSFTPVTGVTRVDMVVLTSIGQSNSYRQRIEIREVTFEGKRSMIAKPMKGDHFQCYGVRKGDNLKVESIQVTDQFGKAELVLGKPVLLCNPSTKIHNQREFGVNRSDRHLVCYDIIKQNQIREKFSVKINNQFAPDDILSDRREMFCVPSSKTHLKDNQTRPYRTDKAIKAPQKLRQR